MKTTRTVQGMTWAWYAGDGCWRDETGTYRIVPVDKNKPRGRCDLYSHRNSPNQHAGSFRTFGAAVRRCAAAW